ncbi:MAG: hypothetical protein Q9166_005424 [cf. Caloplaca sp. 2 TL-2023]
MVVLAGIATPAYHNAAAGQFWLVKPLNQEPAWPVFICPEEIVGEYFKSATRRAANARRADGTFSKAYGQSQHLLPVLYLGNLRMRWVKKIHLEPLDIETVAKEKDNTTNVFLAHAYAELLEQYGQSDDHYWSSRLLAKRFDEEDSESLGEEEAVLAGAQDANDGKPAESNQLLSPYRDDDSDEENLSSLIPDTKRVKLEAGGDNPKSFIPGQASVQQGQLTLRSPAKAAAQGIKVEDVDRTDVRVYVGNPHVVYLIKANILGKSPILAALAKHDIRSGFWYVMAPWLSEASGPDFRPVAEFLNSGEYHPYILDAGTDQARVAGVTSDKEKREEMLKCGMIHMLALKFDLPELQALVLRKLKAMQPFPATQFIQMVDYAFGSGLVKDSLDKFVIDYIADHYFDLSNAGTERFTRLLKNKDALRNEVFARMAPRPTSELAVKTETVTGVDTDLHGDVVMDENTPPAGSAATGDAQAEAATDAGFCIFEDVEDDENDENATPTSSTSRIPFSERKDVPMDADGCRWIAWTGRE